MKFIWSRFALVIIAFAVTACGGAVPHHFRTEGPDLSAPVLLILGKSSSWLISNNQSAFWEDSLFNGAIQRLG
jgi:hypothetical protein